MALSLNGTTGISGIDGSASTPAGQGTDTNTGLFYGVDTVSIATNGTERVKVNSSGQTEHQAGSVSAPAITASGDLDTGVFFSAANTVDVATNGTAGMQLDSSQNLKFNSGYGSVATAYGCRAWVSFNGTSTVAIRASGNVTSITDNGVGDYTVNFTNAMPDANYSVGGSVERNGADVGASIHINSAAAAPTTTACRVCRLQGNVTIPNADSAYTSVQFYR